MPGNEIASFELAFELASLEEVVVMMASSNQLNQRTLLLLDWSGQYQHQMISDYAVMQVVLVVVAYGQTTALLLSEAQTRA